MNIKEIIHYRRSVRHFNNIPIDFNRVKHCLELASLAPNSSNMQLWEFYHITNIDVLKKLSVACLNQQAATSANQLVVFVTRQDLYQQRAKKMLALETQNILKNSPKEKKESNNGQCITERLCHFYISVFLELQVLFEK